jgi:hypothetical protein
LQKHIVRFVSLVIVFLISVSALAVIKLPSTDTNNLFYVGVTYCGDSVEEAKHLIDKVKDYTNLFVLQSGSLMENLTAIQEIGDYAVNAGLNMMLYYGTTAIVSDTCYSMVSLAKERWNSSFLGLYFNDEPGGKMIDSQVKNLYYEGTHNGTIMGSRYYVTVNLSLDNQLLDNQWNHTSVSTSFYKEGRIQVKVQTEIMQPQSDLNMSQSIIITEEGQTTVQYSASPSSSKTITYQPNGTITCTYYYQMTDRELVTDQFTYLPDGTVQGKNGTIVTDQGDISQFEPYQQLLDSNPLGTNAATADTFVEIKQSLLNGADRNQSDLKLFTSDYALYWFDYEAGYDTVFAEFVGNESRERHIALCRGAAETLGRDWGVMITWKYNQAPFLESADELFSDLTLAYSSGAKYVIVFNYENNTAYQSLTGDHLAAMQKFWNTIHTDPASIEATSSKVAYVLPAGYGFGFRSEADTIWGHFPADQQSAKIYNDISTLTGRYGAGLNILYDGPETKTALGIYSTIYYYNQTIT